MPRDGKGKISTYVKRSRALKSARSFSPKFRAAVCHPARAAGVLDAAFGGLPHPKPPQQPSLACKTQQKICNSVTNATFSIFNRAIFYSGPTIFYNIFPRCNPIVAAFFESVNNPQADEWDLDFDTPIPLRPFLTKAEREARETVAARVRKRRRS